MLALALLSSIALVDRAEPAGILFEAVFGSPEKRLIYETIGSGAAFLDYDADGDLDVYLVNGASSLLAEGLPNRLFRNDGSGGFEEVTEASGTGDRGFGVAVATADIDVDGDVDLFVANNGSDVLLRNRGDGTFESVRFDDGLMAGGAAFGDYDRDGLPDLYISSYVDRKAFEPGGKGLELCTWKGIEVGCGPVGLPAAPDRLYRNEGGVLRDASVASGVAAVEPSYGLGILFQDLTGDGRADLYVANDSRPNFLFVNQGDGRFAEEGLLRGAAYSGDGLEQAGMGVDGADPDGDGDVDLVVTNFSHDHTTFYENLGGGFFSDLSYKRGIAKPTYLALSWGVRFEDLDSDGDLDLFVANGHIYPQVDGKAPESPYAQPNTVLRNDGDDGFVPLEPAPVRRSSRGLAAGDYDGDGRVDLLVTAMDGAPELLHNETASAGRALMVALVGLRATREGLGAFVTVETDRGRQGREVTTSGSYASANDPRIHFGLGGDEPTAIEVRWPSGAIDRLPSPGASAILVVKEGRGMVARFPLATDASAQHRWGHCAIGASHLALARR